MTLYRFPSPLVLTWNLDLHSRVSLSSYIISWGILTAICPDRGLTMSRLIIGIQTEIGTLCLLIEDTFGRLTVGLQSRVLFQKRYLLVKHD